MTKQPQPPAPRPLHRCASPLGIILLKLFALPSLYRQGNIPRAATYETDILKLMTLQPVDSEQVLEQLRPNLPPSDLNALRQILTDIQQRLDPAKRF